MSSKKGSGTRVRAKKKTTRNEEATFKLTDLGLSKDTITPVLEQFSAYLLARTLREQAVEKLCSSAVGILDAANKLLLHHGHTIDEAFGLIFCKLKNDTKSKLGMLQPRSKEEKGSGKFKDERSKPVQPPRHHARQPRDKEPLTQNLGDKLKDAGVVLPSGEGEPAQTH